VHLGEEYNAITTHPWVNQGGLVKLPKEVMGFPEKLVHKCKMFMQEKEVLSERNSSVSM
jgi:hypothetical protein